MIQNSACERDPEIKLDRTLVNVKTGSENKVNKMAQIQLFEIKHMSKTSLTSKAVQILHTYPWKDGRLKSSCLREETAMHLTYVFCDSTEAPMEQEIQKSFDPEPTSFSN